jgi:hypothetical protein
MPERTISITYLFQFDSGPARELTVLLDRQTLSLIPRMRAGYPDWTRLSFEQCPNCPLKEGSSPRCPAAVALIDLVSAFKEATSTDSVQVEILGEIRTLSKRTTLSEGVASLLGISMSASGCPILGRLKPNLRTYLPFPSIDETVFRTLSMYLLGQYFIEKRGGTPDWRLEHLGALIEDIRVVNRSLCRRLSGTSLKDVSVNAVVHFDCLAELTTNALREQSQRLAEIEASFDAFPKGAP